MPTNLAIDDALLARAQKLAGLKTKRATVDQALREFIDKRRRALAVKAFGTVDFAEGFNHKKLRAR